ncbi:MAG: hypothetical protein K9H64_10205 [Bacteroidales bacterium]|nr:hypothetical protein [Bacteroidales bacterium]MCF8456240.1 hypothetical protein [Bacteroidales bacterium]
MNWLELTLTSLISIGGFTASAYVVIARRMSLPVAKHFRQNGIMTIIGGMSVLASIILTIITNPWWSFFIILLAGWFFSQLIVKIIKIYAQPLSAVLIIISTTILIVKLIC